MSMMSNPSTEAELEQFRNQPTVKMLEHLGELLKIAEPYLKNGVAEDWQAFIAAIQRIPAEVDAYTAQKCKEARIDELNKQLDSIGIPEVFDDFTDGNATAKRVMYSKLEQRIAELNTSGDSSNA